jgi:hypothetical protein
MSTLLTIFGYYYISIPISKLISPFILYYTGINPLFNPVITNLAVRPIHIVIEYVIYKIDHLLLKSLLLK